MKIKTIYMTILIIFTFVGCNSKNLQEDIPDTEKTQTTNRKNYDTFIVTVDGPSKGDFNSIYSESGIDTHVSDLVYSKLLNLDDDGSYKPVLAKDYSILDNKTYVFNLRENISFSDGTPLTSKDVEFTYLLLCDPSYDGNKSFYVEDLVGYENYIYTDVDYVEGIKVIDDYTISFTFNNIKRTNIETFGNIGILPKNYYSYTKGDLSNIKSKSSMPIGSGRYKLVSYENEALLTLNELYNLNNTLLPTPLISKIMLKEKDSNNTQQLIDGLVDYSIHKTEPEKIYTALDNDHIEYIKYPRSGFGYLNLNTRETSPTSSLQVRQALNYGYDKQTFTDIYFEGMATTQDVPITKTSWAYTDNLVENIIHYNYNPEKSKELLNQAGWILAEDGIRYKNGQPLILKTIAVTDHIITDTLFAILEEQWGMLGVQLNITYTDYDTLISEIYYSDGENWDFYFMATDWYSPDPDNLYTSWHKNHIGLGKSNTSSYVNEDLSYLLDQGRATLNVKDAIPIYEQIGKILNEASVQLVVYTNTYYDLYNERVTGVYSNLWTKDKNISTVNLKKTSD